MKPYKLNERKHICILNTLILYIQYSYSSLLSMSFSPYVSTQLINYLSVRIQSPYLIHSHREVQQIFQRGRGLILCFNKVWKIFQSERVSSTRVIVGDSRKRTCFGPILDVYLKSFRLGFAVSPKIAVSMRLAPYYRPKLPVSI